MRQGAALADVLAGDPDVLAVEAGRAVVAPTGPWRVADLRLVAGEPVVETESGTRDVDVTDADLGIDRRVGGAGEVVLTDQGERHHTPAGRGRGDGRVGEVVVLEGEGAAHHKLGTGRVHDEPLDPGLGSHRRR